MRATTETELASDMACKKAWAWVQETCEAVVFYETTESDPALVLKAFDEVSAMIEAKGMTPNALIEETIGWARNRIEGAAR